MIARQKIPMPPAFPIITTRYEVNENNQVEEKIIDASKVVLPDVETTDLRALLDAGVDVKRVNTKILKGTQIVTDLTPTETKQTKEGVNVNSNAIELTIRFH